MGAVVFDSSVILALLDPEDALHAPAVRAARERRSSDDDFVLPAIALAEVLVTAARRGDAELGARRDLVVAVFGPPRPVDELVALAAARRRARHRSLRLPDALVIATADVTSADLILTGDKRWRDVDDRIQVIC